MQHIDGKRHRRDLDLEEDVKEEEPTIKESESLELLSEPSKIEILKNTTDDFNEILDSWVELTPSIVGCFASVAG